MSFWIRLLSGTGMVWLAIALGGCTPSGGSQLSEEKEPHFVQGKGRVNAMDYQGAIEAFAQSLEANPHSAAAHFELGWLYDEKASDPAAAIFHYQQYLNLNPNAENADVIKQRIYRCKQQLAADVLPLPSAPAAQQQLEKLAEQNRQLQDEVGKWRAYYASQLVAAKTNATPTPVYNAPEPATNPSPVQSAQNVSPAPVVAGTSHPANPKPSAAAPRTHTVIAGETAVGIARKLGVKLGALQEANPGVNLSRIHSGQALNLPSP
jgi:tetratricopeptide (TPR) repeat protein